MTVGQGTGPNVNSPLSDLLSIEQNWTAATPQSIGGAEFAVFRYAVKDSERENSFFKYDSVRCDDAN